MAEKEFYYLWWSFKNRKPFRGAEFGKLKESTCLKLVEGKKKNTRLSNKHVKVYQCTVRKGHIQRGYIIDNKPLYDAYLSAINEYYETGSTTKLTKLSSKKN